MYLDCLMLHEFVESIFRQSGRPVLHSATQGVVRSCSAGQRLQRVKIDLDLGQTAIR